jgi:hypothetical protein
MSLGFDTSQQNKLVQVVRTFATNGVAESAVMQARAAADALKGVVIQSDESGQEVLSLLRQIKDGGKALAETRKRILAPFEQAKREVQDVFFPVEKALGEAEAHGKAALARYQQEQSRLAREAREKEIAEQRKREAEAKEIAEGMGVEAPPPMTMSPQAYRPPAPLATADAQVGRTSTLHCELGNHLECDPTWLKLDTVIAKAVFRREMRDEAEALRQGTPGKKVRFNGVDFWYESGVAIREPGRDSRSL